MVELLKYMGVENPQGDISLTALIVWLLVCILAIGISLWCLDKKNKMSEVAKVNIISYGACALVCAVTLYVCWGTPNEPKTLNHEAHATAVTPTEITYEVNKTHKQYQFTVSNVNSEKVRLTTHDGHQFIVPKKELERELILMKSPV